MTNLPQGSHGFHIYIHTYGDFSNVCTSTRGHYNPLGMTHGAPTDEERYKLYFFHISKVSYITFIHPLGMLVI